MDRLDKIQNEAARITTGCSRFVSISELNQRTDSPESRLVYTRLEVALQIFERKIYKNTKMSSLYS